MMVFLFFFFLNKFNSLLVYFCDSLTLSQDNANRINNINSLDN